jgi:DNA-binding NtrC family response regulator
LTVPPLRERHEDIPLLARHFMKRFAREENHPALTRMTREAEALLCAYDWPGNIRQLENAMFRAVVLAEGDEIGVGEFPQIVAQFAGGAGHGPLVPEVASPATVAHSHALAPSDSDMATAFDRVENAPAAPAPYANLTLLDAGGEVRALEDVEADVIRFAIAHYRGQMSEIARRLGIGRSTLYRKMKEYGFDEGSEAERETSDSLVA